MGKHYGIARHANARVRSQTFESFLSGVVLLALVMFAYWAGGN